MSLASSKAAATWWVARTGQVWKLGISLLLAVAAAGFFLEMVESLNTPATGNQNAAVFYGLAFVGMGVVFFSWLATALKCRRCGYGVVFKLMRRYSLGKWHQKLTTATVCPICGDEGQNNEHPE
ncbi:MAG: hypothetical protein EPN72_00770 [Nevskiaceae bacterium]|nr:MAG: hypothetical protein EPN63_11520 [Nevskiaceae bacterium]TBR74593.1 MAG: hypothetical protein EPN72_00770 [Nevskiaceae bacterium]